MFGKRTEHKIGQTFSSQFVADIYEEGLEREWVVIKRFGLIPKKLGFRDELVVGNELYDLDQLERGFSNIARRV